MSEWSRKPLDEFVKFQRGFDLPKDNFILGSTPVYGSTSILGFHNESKVKAPGVITGRSGTLGKLQYATKDFWPHNTTLWVKDFMGNDSRFAYYLMQCLDFKDFNSGGAVPTLNRNVLKSFKVDVPPLSTQKKIAKILSNYDDFIDNNLKRIKLLEESARLTYEEWFLRFRIDGEKLEIDSETGLPFGWKEKEVTSITTINKKSITVRTAPEYIKYIDISSTDTGYHKSPEIMNFKDAPSRARRVVEYGDTIFSTVRPNRKTYSLILENDPMLIVSTGFAVVSPNVTETFPFVYFTLSSQNFINSAVAVAGGAAYPAINQTDFEKLEIVIPTKDILDKFSKLTSPILKNKSNLLDQNQLLKEARDILLPRLMTGMIDVDELEVAV